MSSDAILGGFSPARLARLTRCMEHYVGRGEVAGVITAIFRRGRLAHLDVIGARDEAANIPLSRDSLFRIASMTKPITSVAALMLLEEGKLRLDDPIHRWLPELARPRVLRNPLGPLDDVYAAPRPITLCDLLTHRPGFVSGLFPQGPIAVAQQPLQSHMLLLSRELDADAWLRHLGSLPLCYAPGERVNYGYATDVLGLLVQRVSGMPFADFLRTRLFEPLGMVDTAFFVPPEKRDRFCVGYGVDAKTLRRIVEDPVEGSKWGEPPRLPSGAAGLVSTMDDYLRFARMLLDNGKFDGQRLLGRKTIELMTCNFLTPEQRRMGFFSAKDFWAGHGFGLGVSIVDDPAREGMLTSIGQYGWGGAYGTHWFNDPAEDMACLLMIQLLSADLYSKIKADFQTLAYQAIDN